MTMHEKAAWLDIIVQEAFFVNGTECKHYTLDVSPQLLLGQVKAFIDLHEWLKITIRRAELHQVDELANLEVF